MDKKQLTGIFAGIGYFLLYACLMMVFQMLYTFVIMGISYIGGTRKEMDFGLFANNNLLTTVLLTIVSVGVIFYLIFKRRGEQISHHYQFVALRFDACLGGWTHIGNRCCTDGAGFCTHLCKDQ